MATSTPLPLPLHLLSLARLGVGTAAFLFPSLTTSTLFYPQPASSLLNTRLWGGRDAVLAVLLHTAKTPEARRTAVIAGAVADVLDVVAAGWGFARGEVEGMAAAGFAGGAISFLVLASVGRRMGGLGPLGKVAPKA